MSQHGIILGLFSSKMYHCTKRNIRDTHVGVALLAKAKVAFRRTKKRKTLEESWPWGYIYVSWGFYKTYSIDTFIQS
jgi:hypothetical protein